MRCLIFNFHCAIFYVLFGNFNFSIGHNFSGSFKAKESYLICLQIKINSFYLQNIYLSTYIHYMCAFNLFFF